MAAGLDRALSARGFKRNELQLARRDILDWARTRVGAARRRRGVVGGLGIVVTKPGRAELRPFDLALAGPGEVTVELLASAISPGTERAQWLRMPNAQPALPFAPGYSGAGRVLAAGTGVDALEAGALVAVPRARHASVVTVPADWVAGVPTGVDVRQAALVYLAIIAGYGVRQGAEIPDKPVCVVGAGPIGALAQRLALLEGPSTVTVVARSRDHEAAALGAGASSFQTIDEPVDGIEAAVVIEATGDPDAVTTAVQAARPGATVVLLGSPRGVTANAPVGELQRKGVRLVGAHVSALATDARRSETDPFAELSRTFLDAVADGSLDVSDLVGESVDPREIGLFYRRLAAREAGAAHLDWTRVPRAERVRRRALVSLPTLRSRAAPYGRVAVPTVRPDGSGLRVAVIGCGDIGLSNARAVAAAAGAEVSVVYDTTPSLAEAVADRTGGAVAASLDDALDRSRADAAFLSVPHDLHAPLAAQAAQAGLHVMVEKPLAVDLSAAQEAAEAAAASGVALSVCFSYRYYSAVQTARELFRAGALGPLRGINVTFHDDKPPSYWLGGFSGRARSTWRTSRERAGGGVLIMNLAHYVDLVRYIAGGEPGWVTGVARTRHGAEVEDAVSLGFTWEGDGIGSFTASASTRGAPPNRFELWGESGTLRLEPDAAVYTERALDDLSPGSWTPLAVADQGEIDVRRIFVERFAAAVLAGHPPDVTPADGLAVQSFIDAAYRAVEDGRPVAVASAATVTA